MRSFFRPVLPLLLIFLMASCSASRHAQRKQLKKEQEKNEALIEKYEKIVGVKIDPQKSLALYQCIDHWMGTPYRYGAAGRSGTDCSGFTGIVYKEVYHINLPRSTEEQLENAHRVKKKHLREGNLVFFKIEKGRKTSHVGIYLGNNKFVHASTSKGVRIDSLEDEYYKNHFLCGGAY